MAKAIGSMIRTTAKGLLTGIRGLPRSSIGERLLMPPNREMLFGAARIMAGRIFPGEVVIAGVVSGIQALPSGVAVKALLVDRRGAAVKRGNKVPAVNRAVKA